MLQNVQTLVKSLACLLVLAGSISACSTVLAPEDDATTEYVFEQSGNDHVVSKTADQSGTGASSEED